MQRVGQLYAAGGTNLYGGVQAALGRMSQAPATHPIRRVFLISDGHANIGPSDPASLTSLAANGTEWGAQISAIGVGYEYDQATLASMVVRTSGRLYHLGQPQQMAHILEQEMGLLSRTVALNAFVEVQPAPGVRIVEGATLGAEVVEGRVRLPLGALYAGQHRELLFRARVDTARPGAHPLGQARLVYEVPGERERRVAERALRYEVTTDVASAETSQAPAVVAMLADHQASEAQRRAASMMRAGRQQDAAAELSRARAALAAAAQRAPSDSASAARMRERAGRMEAASTRATSAPPAMAPATAYDFEAEAIQAEGY